MFPFPTYKNFMMIWSINDLNTLIYYFEKKGREIFKKAENMLKDKWSASKFFMGWFFYEMWNEIKRQYFLWNFVYEKKTMFDLIDNFNSHNFSNNNEINPRKNIYLLSSQNVVK